MKEEVEEEVEVATKFKKGHCGSDVISIVGVYGATPDLCPDQSLFTTFGSIEHAGACANFVHFFSSTLSLTSRLSRWAETVRGRDIDDVGYSWYCREPKTRSSHKI